MLARGDHHQALDAVVCQVGELEHARRGLKMAAENYLREGDFASASAMLVELFMLDEKVERSKLSEEAEAFLLEAVEKCELRGISEWVISQTEPL